MTIDQRIRALRQHLNLSQDGFGERVGVTTQAVSQWETPERPGQDRRPPRPSKKSIASISREFGVRLAWLLSGDGPMFESEETGKGITTVPRLPLVSAGDWWLPEQISEGDELPTLAVADLPPGDWIAIGVEGSSMDRISPPGSIIIVNRAEKALAPNACYVIRDEDGRSTYKRYRPNPPRFEPVTFTDGHETIFPKGKVDVVGRVRRSFIEM